MTLRFYIGESNFASLVEEKTTIIDKTLLIRESMEDPSPVLLFHRPRRFGKTLNLRMLKEFLSLQGLDIFKNFAIAQDPAFCLQHQNQYAVIWLSFKDCSGLNYQNFLYSAQNLMSELYRKHSDILNSSDLSAQDRDCYNSVRDCLASPSDFISSLSHLISHLHQHTGKKVVVLIDEYDTPLHNAYEKGFIDPLLEFYHAFLGTSLHDNPLIHKVIVTGIVNVSYETLFGAPPPPFQSLTMDQKYQSYYGFTQQELETILAPYPDSWQAMQRHYDGYTFGNCKIYNPWSIIMCLHRDAEIDHYWLDTAGHDLLFSLINNSTGTMRTSIENFMLGRPQIKTLPKHLTFKYRENNEEDFWNLLIYTGYANASLNPSDSHHVQNMTLTIPNQEIYVLYEYLAYSWFDNVYVNPQNYWFCLKAIVSNDIDRFASLIAKYIAVDGSPLDLSLKTPAQVFHLFKIGFAIGLYRDYALSQDEESSEKETFFILNPQSRESNYPSISVTLTYCLDPSQLHDVAVQALLQTQSRQSDKSITGPILRIGMAFCGKHMQYQWDKA